LAYIKKKKRIKQQQHG